MLSLFVPCEHAVLSDPGESIGCFCGIGNGCPRKRTEFLEIVSLLGFLMSQVCKAMQRNAAKMQKLNFGDLLYTP